MIGGDVHARRVRVRLSPFPILMTAQRLCREALVWRQIKHPNILPFIGLNSRLFKGNSLPALLSPWMAHGSLKNYVALPSYNAERETFRLVRVSRYQTSRSSLTMMGVISRWPASRKASPICTLSPSRTGTSTT
jgi:hypothetical protein